MGEKFEVYNNRELENADILVRSNILESGYT